MTDKIAYIILDEEAEAYHKASDKNELNDIIKDLLENTAPSSLKLFEIKNELKLKFSTEVEGLNYD